MKKALTVIVYIVVCIFRFICRLIPVVALLGGGALVVYGVIADKQLLGFVGMVCLVSVAFYYIFRPIISAAGLKIIGCIVLVIGSFFGSFICLVTDHVIISELLFGVVWCVPVGGIILYKIRGNGSR